MSDLNTTCVVMSEDEFVSLRDVVKDYCGLYFDIEEKYLLEKRLSKRLAVHQFSSYSEYYLFLKYDPQRDLELDILVDILSTNETYFFRESYQLKAFTDEIIPEIVSRKNDRTLRIWSAGCSTGEEPYTISMLLLHLVDTGFLSGWDINIFGSDLSQRVLGVARKGVYGPNSFREMNGRYEGEFKKDSDGRKLISSRVKRLVTLSRLNLLDSVKIGLLSDMDLIFCRNVIIYFDQDVKKRVIQSFYDKLTSGGYLLLGHSESLMNISTAFELMHFKNDLVYRRPLTKKF